MLKYIISLHNLEKKYLEIHASTQKVGFGIQGSGWHSAIPDHLERERSRELLKLLFDHLDLCRVICVIGKKADFVVFFSQLCSKL